LGFSDGPELKSEFRSPEQSDTLNYSGMDTGGQYLVPSNAIQSCAHEEATMVTSNCLNDSLPCGVDVTMVPDDDPESVFELDVDNDIEPGVACVNSIRTVPPSLVPSSDVCGDDGFAKCDSKDVNAVSTTDEDYDMFHAQIDTGAFVSCTNQKDYLHDYRKFDVKHPCPIKLQPAMEGSDAVPIGYGYLHVPAHNEMGFLQ